MPPLPPVILMQLLEFNDHETENLRLDLWTDSPNRGMATSSREIDPDAMDIDVAPPMKEPALDGQTLSWFDILEPPRGRQEEENSQARPPPWVHATARPYEASDSQHNDENMFRDYVRTTCGACLDIFNTKDIVTIPCGCCYCKPCLDKYFEIGLANRGSFPPKCCGQETTLETVRTILSTRLIKRYEEVSEEFGSRNPTYCAGCSAFLPGAAVFTDFKACQECLEQTCIRCKTLRALHGGSGEIDIMSVPTLRGSRGRQCPGIVVPSELMTLITKQKWNRCPGCQQVVEKTEGCDYMECICGEEFCYKCGEAFDADGHCNCPDNLPSEDEDEEDEDEARDSEEEGGEDGEWPQYAAAVDARGRIRCMHELTNPLDEEGDGEGGRCHGCLRVMPEIRSCGTCQLELCIECLR